LTGVNKDVIVVRRSFPVVFIVGELHLPLNWESPGDSSGNSVNRHHRRIVQIIYQTSDGNCLIRNFIIRRLTCSQASKEGNASTHAR